MDSRFLETFLLVAAHGSYAEVSRRLGITPAAVSQRVQALEAEIGAALLMRSGRFVKPTEAGNAILRQGEEVLSEIRALRILALSDQLAGTLRIGAISTALSGLLPDALMLLRKRLPKVEFFVQPGSSKELHVAVAQRQLDAALIVRPPFTLPKTQAWRMIINEPMVLFTSPALAHRPPLEILESEPFIRYDRSNWGGRIVQKWLEQQKIRPNDWLELDQLEAIAIMVSKGLGAAILPEWSSPWPEGVSAARLRLPGRPVVREIGVVWSQDSPTAPLVNHLLDALGNRHAKPGPGETSTP